MRKGRLLPLVCILSCNGGVQEPERVVIEGKPDFGCLTTFRWTLPTEHVDGSALIPEDIASLTLYAGTVQVQVPAHVLVWQTVKVGGGVDVYATVTTVEGVESDPSNTVTTSCYEGVL